jgi:molybdopterin synthase sulfur carrier subunit
MSLKLVFIGRLEDAAGEGERQVANAGSIARVLAALEPDLAAALRGERVRIAVNGKVIAEPADTALHDGDEIAFLPPVSGG